MNGKILKIFSNDLYGNPDDRKLAVFAAFEHKKYMNKYAIFSFEGDYDKKKLYYGSIHLKSNALVIFEVNDASIQYVDTFVEEYMSGNINSKEYELIDISNCEKVELISSTEKDFNELEKLDAMSIKREVIKQDEGGSGGKGGLYFLLFLFIALGIGVTYVYLNPDVLTVKLKQLNCTKDSFNEEMNMRYTDSRIVKFDKQDVPISIDITNVYKFKDYTKYNEFKSNGNENTYFNFKGEYKYDDINYELKIYYTEDTIIESYSEMFDYLKKEGFTCQEEMYEE